NPHYDPQRQSLGEVQMFARQMDLAAMTPTDDPAICSTTFCLASLAREYLAYQPDTEGDIVLALPAGNYSVRTFDAAAGTMRTSSIHWTGGRRTFARPAGVGEDWLLHVRAAGM